MNLELFDRTGNRINIENIKNYYTRDYQELLNKINHLLDIMLINEYELTKENIYRIRNLIESVR